MKTIQAGRKYGAFKVLSAYSNHAGKNCGARLSHIRTGQPVDVLFFPSVPQFSITFKTPVQDDKGCPHSLEHIVLSKGAKGKYLSMLSDMTLCEFTAATYSELTAYQFNVSGGMSAFYKVAEAALDTLLRPDFTDEEVRREIYNPDAELCPGGKGYRLEEKGSVYTEMVSACEKPSSAAWHALGPLVFGKGHPLAYNSGGEPSQMRRATVADIRAFHSSHYRLGPDTGLIVCLPAGQPLESFLTELDSIFERLSPGNKPAGREKRLPTASGGKSGKIVLAPYPSAVSAGNEDVFFAWKPFTRLSVSDGLELGLLLDLLGGGESSYLYSDLVDSATRKTRTAFSGVSAFVDDPPSNMAGLCVFGLPSRLARRRELENLRGIIMKRLEWLSSVKAGSRECGELRRKAFSLLSARRRGMIKFVYTAPRFGDRSGGVSWHKHLEQLNEECGARIDLSQLPAIDSLAGRIAAGENIWPGVVQRFGLGSDTYCVCSKPDASLLRSQKRAKELRLAALEKGLLKAYKAASAQEALEKKFRDSAAAAEEIDRRDRAIPKPAFVKNPPLVLDDTIKASLARLRGGGELLLNDAGDSPFVEAGLYFRLPELSSGDLVLAPLLTSALNSVGVRTADGRELDYAAMLEEMRAQIYSLRSGVSSNPWTGRLEISLKAASCGTEELARLFEWLENCLFRPLLDVRSKGRIIDLLNESMQETRTIMNCREEEWVRDAAAALVHRDKPAFLALRSPFTELRLLERLRWRVHSPSEDAKGGLLSALAKLRACAEREDRDGFKKSLALLPQELAGQFGWHLEHLPEQGWHTVLSGMLSEAVSDLEWDCGKTVAALKVLMSKVFAKGPGLRAVVTAGRPHLPLVRRKLEALIGALPDAPVAGLQSSSDVVLSNLAARGVKQRRLLHAALVNESAKTGVFVISGPGISYQDAGVEKAVDYLAVKAVSGGGPHSIFMKTWASGMAYSNGLNVNPSTGRLLYYAERCPSLAGTISFVAGLVKDVDLSDRFLLEYALANSFTDYRGADDYSARGYDLAADYADGLSPAQVRRFKTALLRAAGRVETLARLKPRLLGLASSLMPGLGRELGGKTTVFVIGPETLLKEYEKYLASCGEKEPLVRLFPADFALPG